MDDIEDIEVGNVGKKEKGEASPRLETGARRGRVKETILQDNGLDPTGVPGTQSVFVRTWGCSHNNSDGEYMAGLLAAYGYEVTEKAEDADVWVLNSCTVKNPAESHFVNEIGKARTQGKHVVVAGCVPQAAPKQKGMEGVSVVGVQQIDRVVEVVEETLKGHTVQLMSQRKGLSSDEWGRFVQGKKRRKLGGASLALPKIRKNYLVEILPISTGCLNQCTYCKTKHARGDLGSYTIEEITMRVKDVLQDGVREIWMSSEDTGAYGRDINTSLPSMLRAVVDLLPKGTMLRLGMTNPPYILEHLPEVAEILRHPNVYSFLHVPVQAGSDHVLDDMKRKYHVQDFEVVVDYLREHVSGITISTDIICGFPTESEEDFEETLKLVEKYKFPILNISQFYPRPGTPAAKMKRVPTQDVKNRSRKLTRLFESYRCFDDHVGRVEEVLATDIAYDKQHLVAHNKQYIQVLVPRDPNLMGKTFKVRIVRAEKFCIIGEVIEETVALAPALPTPPQQGALSNASKYRTPAPESSAGPSRRNGQDGPSQSSPDPPSPSGPVVGLLQSSSWILLLGFLALAYLLQRFLVVQM